MPTVNGISSNYVSLFIKDLARKPTYQSDGSTAYLPVGRASKRLIQTDLTHTFKMPDNLCAS